VTVHDRRPQRRWHPCTAWGGSTGSWRAASKKETRELALDRHLEDCIALEGRFANVEGLGEVSIRELVRDALRMRSWTSHGRSPRLLVAIPING